jgi:hypothetical protein
LEVKKKGQVKDQRGRILELGDFPDMGIKVGESY